MNYLAHSFLSNNDQGLLVGNFIADHLRGNDFSAYPGEVIAGIQLHRRIDSFTDLHPKFKASKRLFYNGFEKYSGILVDIYFDHLLARSFSKYSPTPLQKHCSFVYGVYQNHLHLLPESSAGFLNYVLQNNVFYNYSSVEGIQRVLYHLSHRIGHGIRLDASLELFESQASLLEENFNCFFSDASKEFLPVSQAEDKRNNIRQ